MGKAKKRQEARKQRKSPVRFRELLWRKLDAVELRQGGLLSQVIEIKEDAWHCEETNQIALLRLDNMIEILGETSTRDFYSHISNGKYNRVDSQRLHINGSLQMWTHPDMFKNYPEGRV